MYMFTKKYKTYDDYDKKKLTNEINAAYQFGRAGNEKNEPVTALRTKVAADIAALERTQQLFSSLSGSEGLHKHIRDHLVQDRKWLGHYDKCIEQTKKGFEQLKVDAKALVDDAFAAGELSAEKALTVKLAAERAKQQSGDKNNGQDKNRNNGQNNQNNDKRQTLVVERMFVKELDTGKKKDKNKKNKPEFKQVKH